MSRVQVRQDRSTWFVALAACVALLVGFAAVWYFQLQAERERWTSSYTRLDQVAVSRGSHSISARIAVRTSNADLNWTTQHQDAIKVTLQQALLELEPAQLRTTGALQAFQEGLLARLNETLQSDKIQQVVLTDFLVSEH